MKVSAIRFDPKMGLSYGDTLRAKEESKRKFFADQRRLQEIMAQARASGIPTPSLATRDGESG